MDFLYRGEANVFQENLDSFLAIAEELQLKGLMGKTEDKSRNLEEDEKPLPAFNAHAKIPKPSFRRQAPSKEIHNPDLESRKKLNYPMPITDLSSSRKRAIEVFSKI